MVHGTSDRILHKAVICLLCVVPNCSKLLQPIQSCSKLFKAAPSCTKLLQAVWNCLKSELYAKKTGHRAANCNWQKKLPFSRRLRWISTGFLHRKSTKTRSPKNAFHWGRNSTMFLFRPRSNDDLWRRWLLFYAIKRAAPVFESWFIKKNDFVIVSSDEKVMKIRLK